jgi:hypothetical protein
MTTNQTRIDRLAHLDRQQARCDANSRSCVNRAVDQYDVYRLDGKGRLVSREIEHRQSCGYHRVQFLQSAMYQVVARRPVPRSKARTNG